MWTPFAFARFAGSYLIMTRKASSRSITIDCQPIPNAAQGAVLQRRRRPLPRPGVARASGFEWRYPILARSFIGDIVFEPIAQVIARPNETSIPSLVNIDAQSLVFDDSTLFEWSKFSGYDRFETGMRLNYGGQATLSLPNGGFINAMTGQSRQIAGANSYAQPDAANVGLDSGLDSRASDIVGRFAFAPSSRSQFVAKGRFDKDSLRARRIDVFATINLDPITLHLQYANYASQPAIGFDVRRQGLSATGKYDITKNYFLTGTVTFDMSRYLYNSLTNPTTVYYGTTLTGIKSHRHARRVFGRDAWRRHRLSGRMHDAIDQLFADLSAAVVHGSAGAKPDDNGHAPVAHLGRSEIQLWRRFGAAERRRSDRPSL